MSSSGEKNSFFQPTRRLHSSLKQMLFGWGAVGGWFKREVVQFCESTKLTLADLQGGTGAAEQLQGFRTLES